MNLFSEFEEREEKIPDIEKSWENPQEKTWFSLSRLNKLKSLLGQLVN